MESEILKYLFSKYPEEGCGLLINVKGKLRWKPCENVAEDKQKTFSIHPKEYVAASLIGDIHAVIHSHVNGTCEPSEADKTSSNFLQVPYHIYSIPEKEKFVYTPEYKKIPLLGRTYEFGKTDCWTLVRDYYKQELNIKLPNLVFEPKFYEKGINYFEDLIAPWGGVEVGTPRKGDIIYFTVDHHPIPNHCGVYLGEDIFMHHQETRLSCRDSLPKWNKYVRSFIRCKKYI